MFIYVHVYIEVVLDQEKENKQNNFPFPVKVGFENNTKPKPLLIEKLLTFLLLLLNGYGKWKKIFRKKILK